MEISHHQNTETVTDIHRILGKMGLQHVCKDGRTGGHSRVNGKSIFPVLHSDSTVLAYITYIDVWFIKRF